MITSQLLYHLTIGAKLGGPLEDRTPTSAVQRRRAPIITSSPISCLPYTGLSKDSGELRKVSRLNISNYTDIYLTWQYVLYINNNLVPDTGNDPVSSGYQPDALPLS